MIRVNHLSNKYLVVFSLLVHESLLCVYDQILNWSKYVPNSAVIIHVSTVAPFDLEELGCLLSDISGIGIYLNPKRLETNSLLLLQAHMSNWNAIQQSGITCEYIIMEASNSMFCRYGALQHIFKFDCGYRQGWTAADFANIGWHNHPMGEDHNFIRYMNGQPLRNHQPEGSWFRYSMFLPVLHELNQYCEDKGHTGYNTEEVYPHMLWRRKYPNATTSDTYLWMKQEQVTDNFFDGLFKPITIPEIKSVTDGKCTWGKNVYAVKRIPREYNHLSRVFIRHMKK
jgi:hypothetical protein